MKKFDTVFRGYDKYQVQKCLDEIIETKKMYDISNIKLEEDREIPIDYVYRD